MYASDAANRQKTWDFICPYSVFNNNTDPGLVIKNLKQCKGPEGFFPFPFFIAHIFFSYKGKVNYPNLLASHPEKRNLMDF